MVSFFPIDPINKSWNVSVNKTKGSYSSSPHIPFSPIVYICLASLMALAIGCFCCVLVKIRRVTWLNPATLGLIQIDIEPGLVQMDREASINIAAAVPEEKKEAVELARTTHAPNLNNTAAKIKRVRLAEFDV